MYLDTCGAAMSLHQLGMLCMSFPVLQYQTQTCQNEEFLHMNKLKLSLDNYLNFLKIIYHSKNVYQHYLTYIFWPYAYILFFT